MSTNKVWFVTGASKGLGLSLVKQLLAMKYRVAATSRTVEDLSAAVGVNEDFLPLQVDITREDSVAAAVHAAIDRFGGIDVVVNNAGYGQIGTIEEVSGNEVQQNFDINVFGLLNVMRQVMPHFRDKRSGHFFNISSIAGFLGTFAGWGIYNATKFAVAGLTEAFQAEAQSLGVKATIVYPGYFKTNFLLKGSMKLSGHPIADYKEARELERMHQEDIPGNQPGDPDKAAIAIIRVAEQDQAPLHLFLGSDAVGLAKAKVEAIQQALAATEDISLSTDFRAPGNA